jgi:hypothetical protein
MQTETQRTATHTRPAKKKRQQGREGAQGRGGGEQRGEKGHARAKDRQKRRQPSFHRCHRDEQKKFAGRGQMAMVPPQKKKSEDQQQLLHRTPGVERKKEGRQDVKRK